MSKRDKHRDFLKSIRIPVEESDRNRRIPRKKRDKMDRPMSPQEELDLQKELERRFDELFGSTDE